MITSQDYLHLPAWEALVEMINNKYQAGLDPASCELVHFTPRSLTEVEVTVRRSRSQRAGNPLPAETQWTVRYDRLNLNVLGVSGSLALEADKLPLTGHELLERLQTRTGYRLEASDFQILPTVVSPGTKTLTAHQLSLRWVGQLNVVVTTTKRTLGNLLTQRSIPQTDYLTEDGHRAVASWLTFPVDFTPFRHLLQGLQPGNQRFPARWLLAMIRTAAQVDLGYDRPYTTLYNGPVTPDWTPRTDKRFVAVVSIPPTEDDAWTGLFLLHYD